MMSMNMLCTRTRFISNYVDSLQASIHVKVDILPSKIPTQQKRLNYSKFIPFSGIRLLKSRKYGCLILFCRSFRQNKYNLQNHTYSHNCPSVVPQKNVVPSGVRTDMKTTVAIKINYHRFLNFQSPLLVTITTYIDQFLSLYVSSYSTSNVHT